MTLNINLFLPKVTKKEYFLSNRKTSNEKSPIERKLGIEVAPVVTMSLSTSDAPNDSVLLSVRIDDVEFMKRQPGFIATLLNRTIGESPTHLTYTAWETYEAFRTAFAYPEFREKLSAYHASTFARAPLLKKLGIADVCTA